MRTRLVVALVAAASLAALAPAAAAPHRASAVPAGTDASAKEAVPLLGLAWNDAARRTEVVHVDPETLRTLPGPALGVGRYGTSWAYSPDRTLLALATRSDSRRGLVSSLQIVDPTTLRRQLALPLGSSHIHALTWLEPDRVLVVRVAYHPERLEVLTVAPSAKRVIARSTLQGEVSGVERTRDALVVLLSPKGRIGAATLAVASASGDVRSVGLDRVWIGFERADTTDGEYVGTQRAAGFTVDPDGRAFVFPAGSDAAAIDLHSMSVTYHALREPVSLFGRLRRFLDPEATAKMIDGPWREASWLGGGIVALTGIDHATWRDRESRIQQRSTPAGLTLVDTNSWRARTLDRGASVVRAHDGLLLATGGSWDSSTRVSASMGLAAYERDGSRRFRLFADEQIYVVQAFRGLAYIGYDGRPLRIVELASGRVVGTRRDMPPLLLVDDS